MDINLKKPYQQTPMKKPAMSGQTQVIERLPNGQFPPGVSGNPSGPKPGYKQLKIKVREALEEISEVKDKKTGKPVQFERLFVQTIIKKAIIDEDVSMIKIIWNYLDGMPQQFMDVTNAGKEFGEIDPATKALIDKRFKMNMR